MRGIRQVFDVIKRSIYHAGGAIAIIICSILLCLAILKLLTYPIEVVRHIKQMVFKQALHTTYREAVLSPETMKVYPGKSEAEISAILADWAKRPDFFPENHISYASKYLNVCAGRYRLVDGQRPFARENGRVNVFFFGGSTTFGIQLPDNETIAAYFQREMNAVDPLKRDWCVYNFGVLSNYSYYESLFLSKLIHQGMVPDYVVFIDGLTDFARLALELDLRSKYNQYENNIVPGLSAKILGGVKGLALYWAALLKVYDPDKNMQGYKLSYTQKDIELAAREMLYNWRMVRGMGCEFGFKSLFVLQPLSVYPKVDEDLFLKEEDVQNDGRRWYYRAAREGRDYILRTGFLRPFPHLDLTGLSLRNGYKYVDSCHYTAAFSKKIASEIVNAILAGSMPPLAATTKN